MPKVSVVIPVYNVENYLKQCLNSIVNQTLRDIEIICVDDGSSDASINILNEYVEKDNRIRILKQKNQYAGVARNNGLKIATGEYVHFMDADDYICDEDLYYKWYNNAIDNYADIVFCGYHTLDIVTGEKNEKKRLYNKDIYVTDIYKDPTFVIYSNIAPWNKIYRRDFLEENDIKYQDIICANDRYFFFKAIKYAQNITYTDYICICHRINNTESLVGNKRLKNYEVHFISYEAVWQEYLDVDDNIRRKILDVSFLDFFTFLKKSRNTPYEDDVNHKLLTYVSKMDCDLFDVDNYNRKWFTEYLRLSLPKTFVDNLIVSLQKAHMYDVMQVSRSYEIYMCMVKVKRKILGGIKCFKEHGLVYTIHRTVFHIKKYIEGVK